MRAPQEYAQRALSAYVRSVFLQPNKKVFDVAALPLTEYAASLGLLALPKLRFLKKVGAAGRQAASHACTHACTRAQVATVCGCCTCTACADVGAMGAGVYVAGVVSVSGHGTCLPTAI